MSTNAPERIDKRESTIGNKDDDAVLDLLVARLCIGMLGDAQLCVWIRAGHWAAATYSTCITAEGNRGTAIGRHSEEQQQKQQQ